MPNFGPQPEKSSAKSKNNPENERESSKENLSVSEIVEKYGLQSGIRASFKKQEKFGDSPLDEGTVMGGVLDNDVSVGSSIEFENQDAKISTIQDVYEENGDVYLTTQTSVYSSPRKPQALAWG
jgi:citrate lyase alpha subunit